MSEVDKLAQATKKSFDKVDIRFNSVKDRLGKVERRLGKVEDRLDKVERRLGKVEDRLDKLVFTIKDSEKTIIYEFKALAENIHQDVAGANQDKISLIEQKQENLEKRVSRVEQKVGV